MKNRGAIQNTLVLPERNFSSKKFWVLAFGMYTALEGFYWVFHYLNIYRQHVPWLLPAAYYIIQWLLSIVFTGFVWFFLNCFYGKNRLLVISLNISVFMVHYTAWIWINYYLHNSGSPWLMGNNSSHISVTGFIYSSWFDIGKYVLEITAFYVLKFYCGYRQSEQDRIQLAVINKDLQLNLLKQQLSPHFYFNTLNNLYGLARTNNSSLSPALEQLSNIMRYVIVECNQPKVDLQKEIDFLQSYISLEKLRYQEGTVIDMQVEGNVKGHTILPLMLIQFVENAFKHGMKEKSEQNWMKVKMIVRNAGLLFLVDNSYCTIPAAEGIGLSSVKHRLNLQYDGKYGLQINTSGSRFSVTLNLDLS